ncbi:MAG: hypothetical protein HKN21_13900 [Candidatus Eisenbacteria bacterium]|uniref:Uncharacterized protein n=1 Tax=Eiseniibacteriota bacterium TaxID=2212470 RepID=A0A7Y2H3H9_UNCEI|nr:hypothetical protein [Candidatus Eisenbacteria bacterium]
MNPRHGVLLTLALCALALIASGASALPELDLGDRILIDGFSDEFERDEFLFQSRPQGGVEESTSDSQWGLFNDVNQMKITWDANFVYVAIDGFIFNNNTMVFFDTVPLADGQNPGLTSLSQVNSWRRAVSFDNGIFPDLFAATWDGNTTPQLWTYTGPNQVAQIPQGSFPTVASFSGDLPRRSMEAAIPWDVFFLGQGVREFDPAYGDTIYRMPDPDFEVRIVSWITAGADGTGGPDSAPDNLSGHQVDGSIPVVLDNYVRLRMDRFDANGDPNPDGVPDFGQPVRTPTRPDMSEEEYRAVVDDFFFLAPPIRGTALEIKDIRLEPRAFAPDLGEDLEFLFTITPEIQDELLREVRRIDFTAEVFDLNGRKVRTLYDEAEFTIASLDGSTFLPVNRFDGRDDEGRILEGGVYLLRLILEPDQDQTQEALVVVR